MHEELIGKLQNAAMSCRAANLYIAAYAVDEAIQALTAPQAETCEKKGLHKRQAGEMFVWVKDERGDVVDRRENKYDSSGYPASRLRRVLDFGRRSADRSRWVQETPQTQVSFEKWHDSRMEFKEVTVYDLCLELDRRSAGK